GVLAWTPLPVLLSHCPLSRRKLLTEHHFRRGNFAVPTALSGRLSPLAVVLSQSRQPLLDLLGGRPHGLCPRRKTENARSTNGRCIHVRNRRGIFPGRGRDEVARAQHAAVLLRGRQGGGRRPYLARVPAAADRGDLLAPRQHGGCARRTAPAASNHRPPGR